MAECYDVIIVGGGPAGLTAALYLARAKYRCLVLEKAYFGGQIAITEEVVNYPGIEKISGTALTEAMKAQAEHFGAEFRLEEAVEFDLAGDRKTVKTAENTYYCTGILLAMGAYPRTVGFLGEEKFKGRGVAYCATCDGEFFTGKQIFVIGGGYAAAEEGLFLTKFADHVTILVRKGDFSCAATVADKAKNHEKITVLTNTVMEEVDGENGLHYARYRNTQTGEVTEFRSEENFGVFVLAGYAPATEKIRHLVDCDDRGYLITDRHGKTSLDGVYGAGDICIKPLRQVVTATADGALAATELEKYVAAVQEQNGLQKTAPIPAKTEEKSLFDRGVEQQLEGLFRSMRGKVLLKLSLDERDISEEVRNFAAALAKMTDRISIATGERRSELPCVEICSEEGNWSGLAFHGVPGGHEFTPFMLGIYNVAGPGQSLEEDTRRRILAIDHPVEMKILVSQSCTMCPDLVAAAQKIAAENPLIQAEVYDIRHFEQLRSRYNVMSVPCLVINGEQIHFGRRSLGQILELLA